MFFYYPLKMNIVKHNTSLLSIKNEHSNDIISYYDSLKMNGVMA